MTKPLPSNSSFGRSCTGVFAALGIFSLAQDGVMFPLWLSISVSAATLTVFRPDALESPNRAWAHFVETLRTVVLPGMMRALFLGMLVPMGAAMKRLQQLQLRLRRR